MNPYPGQDLTGHATFVVDIDPTHTVSSIELLKAKLATYGLSYQAEHPGHASAWIATGKSEDAQRLLSDSGLESPWAPGHPAYPFTGVRPHNTNG